MGPEDPVGRLKGASKVISALEHFILRIGKASSWLNFVLVGVIIVQVVLRYVFGRGLVVLEEVQWHLYGVGIMIGLSYCLTNDSHIRLDILHNKFSKRTQEKIEFLGIIFLLMPMVIIIFLHGMDYFWEAVKINERSDAPLGLCCRWAPKAIIPLSMILLFIAGIARAARAFMYLRDHK